MLHILRRLRRIDTETGISAPRLSLLSVLVFGGEKSISELSVIEQISMAAASKLVSALERQGFARRRRDKNDNRVQLISATVEGRNILEKGRARRVKRLVKDMAQLDDREHKVLLEATEIFEMMLKLE
jgi:DNA-binding MarR family transcriptional regulator